MKTTWTLELKGDRAQRAARGLRRDLLALQVALEQVDGASARLNSTLSRFNPASATRRVQSERAVARAARQTADTQRVGHARVSQDLRTQQRIRDAVDRAQRVSSAREARRELGLAAQRRQSAAAAARTADRDQRAAQRASERQARDTERQRRAGVRSLREQNSSSMSIIGSVGGVMGQIVGLATTITATAGAMAAGFAAVGMQIGQILVQMASFRASAITTLGAVLGGRGAGVQRIGAAALRRSQAVARATPADLQGAVEADMQIAAAGYRGRDAERLQAASLDVQALRGTLDPTAQQRFILGMSQLHGSARARQEDIRQTALAAGLGVQNVERRAANLAGVTQNTGETDLAYQRRIDAARLSGRITGQHAERAVMGELQGLTGQQLGGLARAQGNSLAGAASNLEGAAFSMLTSFPIDQLPGMLRLRDTIRSLGDALGGSSAAGQRLQRSLAVVIDMFGQTIGGALTPQRVEQIVGAIADFLPQAAEVIRLMAGPAWEGFIRGLGPLVGMFRDAAGDREGPLAFFQQLAESLGVVVGFSVRVTVAFAGFLAVLTMIGAAVITAFGAISSAPMQLLDMLASVQTTVSNLAIGIGAALVAGIRTGITNAIGSVRETVGSFAGTIVDTARGALGIHSPSRVFAELGAYSAEGFTIGLERGRPDVGAAVGSMLSAPAQAGGAGARGPVSITIHVDGRGADDETLAERLARRVADIFAGDMDLAAQTVG